MLINVIIAELHHEDPHTRGQQLDMHPPHTVQSTFCFTLVSFWPRILLTHIWMWPMHGSWASKADKYKKLTFTWKLSVYKSDLIQNINNTSPHQSIWFSETLMMMMLQPPVALVATVFFAYDWSVAMAAVMSREEPWPPQREPVCICYHGAQRECISIKPAQSSWNSSFTQSPDSEQTSDLILHRLHHSSYYH